MIRTNGITKCFGSFAAIEDVSFQVDKGEIVGFLGPNGAGKSTTLRILAGVFPPTRGSATIAGYDVAADSMRARALVGYFPERISLYAEMTVEDYLRYVARLKGIARDRVRAEASEAIETASVAPVASRLIGTLSKGYRQRVGLAQALLGRPPVLILDEPTAGLDPEQVADMRAFIRGLRGHRTVILSTHVLPEVEATCDRVIIIHRGKVRAVDTPEGLNRRLVQTSRVLVELADHPSDAAERLRRVPGVVAVEEAGTRNDICTRLIVSTEPECDRRAEIATCIAGAGWRLRELRALPLSLEDIFLALVRREEEEEVAQ